MRKKFDLKAFEEGGADQDLRQVMEGYRVEPDPGLWKDISRKLIWNELLHFNFTNVTYKFWITGVAGVMLVATGIYFAIPAATKNDTAGNPVTTVPAMPAPVASPAVVNVAGQSRESGGVVAENGDVSPLPLQTGGVNAKQADNTFAAMARDSKSGAGVLPSSGIKVISGKLSAAIPGSDENSLPVKGGESMEVSAEIRRMESFGASLEGFYPNADTIITISNVSGTFKFRKGEPGGTQFFSAGLGIMPEMAFYNSPDDYSKANFWLNGDLTWHISAFSLSSGFGLGYVYDQGQYRVEYKSLDSVGYYTSITSFTVGAGNEVYYNTMKVNVYDSLHHLGDIRTKNRYAYLQIPLLLGYRFFESNRASLTLRAGPAISLLLGTRESDPVIEYSNATIIRADDETPDRVQTNWQVWAGLFFEMRLNTQVSMYLEPSFKYYLKPMVTKENGTFSSPLTVGLGVGVQFNFGQKKNNP